MNHVSTAIEFTIGPPRSSQPLDTARTASTFVVRNHCPVCGPTVSGTGTWGTYIVKKEVRQRFRCRACTKTFNVTKIPFWQKHITELVWNLAQLTIKDGVSIQRLAQQYQV